jgi:23S rRNA pseudouridine1911/1915/1917 synthase
LLVIDKPAGMVTVSEKEESDLVSWLSINYPQLSSLPRSGVIHRLDKDTSGIILVAKNQETLDFYQKQFQEGLIKKKYIALAVGQVEKQRLETDITRAPNDRRRMKAVPVLGGRKAVTFFNPLKNFEKYSLIEAWPETGRKHQIRCHLRHLGHPLAGDKLYNFRRQPCPDGLDRHFLHAQEITVKNRSGKDQTFFSPLPEELKKIIYEQDNKTGNDC